jgi:hypothetical protein
MLGCEMLRRLHVGMVSVLQCELPEVKELQSAQVASKQGVDGILGCIAVVAAAAAVCSAMCPMTAGETLHVYQLPID